MTAKVYDSLKELKPRIVEYKQNSSDPDDPNAKVTIQFACSLEHEKGLAEFIKACNEAPDEDTAGIVGSSVISIFFEVVSDHDFTDKVIKDIL